MKTAKRLQSRFPVILLVLVFALQVSTVCFGQVNSTRKIRFQIGRLQFYALTVKDTTFVVPAKMEATLLRAKGMRNPQCRQFINSIESLMRQIPIECCDPESVDYNLPQCNTERTLLSTIGLGELPPSSSQDWMINEIRVNWSQDEMDKIKKVVASTLNIEQDSIFIDPNPDLIEQRISLRYKPNPHSWSILYQKAGLKPKLTNYSDTPYIGTEGLHLACDLIEQNSLIQWKQRLNIQKYTQTSSPLLDTGSAVWVKFSAKVEPTSDESLTTNTKTKKEII